MESGEIPSSELPLKVTKGLLLAKGADVNAPGKYRNALQCASAEGHGGIVQLLLAEGADFNALGGDEYITALQQASDNGHQGVVQLLLANGATINA